MQLVFNVENRNSLIIRLKRKPNITNKIHLTVSQDFDILLIRAIDKILCKNKISRLSLKSVEISGKIEPGALSGMVLQSAAKALVI